MKTLGQLVKKDMLDYRFIVSMDLNGAKWQEEEQTAKPKCMN